MKNFNDMNGLKSRGFKRLAFLAMPVTVSDLMAERNRVDQDNQANLDEIDRLKAEIKRRDEEEKKKNENNTK
jgi:hypothetical protein